MSRVRRGRGVRCRGGGKRKMGFGWRIIYACAPQGIEAALVGRVRGAIYIGYITGRMEDSRRRGETVCATCGSRFGGSHLFFDFRSYPYFIISISFSFFPFSCLPVIISSRSRSSRLSTSCLHHRPRIVPSIHICSPAPLPPSTPSHHLRIPGSRSLPKLLLTGLELTRKHHTCLVALLSILSRVAELFVDPRSALSV